MALVGSPSCVHHDFIHISPQPSWTVPVAYSPVATKDDEDHPRLEEPDSSAELDGLCIDHQATLTTVNEVECAIQTSNEDDGNPSTDVDIPLPRMSIEPSDVVHGSHAHYHLERRLPFQRWVRSLHRRARHRPAVLHLHRDLPRDCRGSDGGGRSPLLEASPHRKSSSSSSFRFVSAVRSASISLASVSAVIRSRTNAGGSGCLSRTDRSSRASISGPRISEDGTILDGPAIVDAAATERSLQRRRILEELITTEEAYIGDIRFLMNVYITILASLPTLRMGLRWSINQNLTEMVELHEELLGELHRVVPHSEYSQLQVQTPLTASSTLPARVHCHGHRRWVSLDAVPENDVGRSWLQNVPGMLSDPQVAAEVSKVFGKKMNKLFIYKEYGAKYEMMIQEIATARRAMPEWENYQRGLEALAATLEPVRGSEDKSKKSLTVSDLLVKPIQRVCRYPLLFSELLKYTPIVDCPNSHMKVENTLVRLREATAEINRATNDVAMKATLEKTWLLQDRLVFPSRKLDAISKNRVRSFGHVLLCGTLHVCWQTKAGVEGQYLICLLYRDVLCLASAGKVDPIYTILACVNVNAARVEGADNGRGLQCHTAPFSWKLAFECDHQLYELLMTACTPKEEMEWLARLARPVKDDFGLRDTILFSSLELNIKSLGTVFGRPGTIARRISIHRATTVGPKSPLCHVILKNTSVVRDAPVNASTTSVTINRSQSLLTTNNRVPVLAPARSERARLETLLADVWSREILPFPGMTTRSRSEHLVRSSASSVIRKLSVASIASSFTKRSGSVCQRTRSNEYGTKGEPPRRRDAKSDGNEPIKYGSSDDPETGRRTKRPRADQIVPPDLWPDAFMFDRADMSGTVRRRESVGLTTQTAECAGLSRYPALRRTSAKSVALSQTTRSNKPARSSIGKEHASWEPDRRTTKSNSRWARYARARNGNSYSFRSLFR